MTNGDAESGSHERVPCGFEPCTCEVDPRDEFCGPTCRFGLGDRKEPCKCGHGECTATSGKG